MTANPSNNWLKERVYDKWKNGTLPNGMDYIPAKIYDNPYIPADYYESLKMLPRYQYEVFVEGNWDLQLKTGGEFYKCFELDKHVKPVEYNPLLPLHISWDDNVNPYLPCGIFQIENKELRMIDEIAGVTPRNTVKEVCAEILRKYPAHNSGMFVYGDATADKEDTKLEHGMNFYRLVIDYLKQYRPQLRVMKSNPSVVMRGNWINTVFEKGIGGVSVIIGEHCKKSINDLIMTKEAADGTKNKEMETDPKTKVRYQKVGHFSDLFDYVMVSAFANEFARYQAGDIVSNISFGKNNPSKNSY
jgi:phage terminase large subunit